MKKIILIISAALLLIAIAITTVILLKNDTPAPTLRNAKKIEKGMNYSEVIDILGEEDEKVFVYHCWNLSDAPYNLFISFSNNQNPYEFIVSSLYLVKIISRDDAQKIQVGMSLQEVEDLLGSEGMPYSPGLESYQWCIEDGGTVTFYINKAGNVYKILFRDAEQNSNED